VTEPLLFTATRITTFDGRRPLTNASGFFFERDRRLYLVTCRHVLRNDATDHFPDRIELEIHIDMTDLRRSTGFSIPLYRDRKSQWRQGSDSGGEVDVAIIELDRTKLPRRQVLHAFTPAHLAAELDAVELGTPLLILGFPLGFHDTVFHLPVVRQAGLASAFGIRFQGEGYFLTDARTHRGTSGAPVLTRNRRATAGDPLPWTLLGVHASRMDVSNRDAAIDESLALNCAWYADILLTLTEP
jgi:S1-C subfamily serine protease